MMKSGGYTGDDWVYPPFFCSCPKSNIRKFGFAMEGHKELPDR